MQASPELVSAFKDARAKYHEAILAWWHRKPRRKGETPSDEDWERVKRDRNVLRAGQALDAIDEELTRAGNLVRISTVKNDRTVQRQIRAEERLLDKDFYSRRIEDEEEEERPAKRRKVSEGANGTAALDVASDLSAQAQHSSDPPAATIPASAEGFAHPPDPSATSSFLRRSSRGRQVLS